MASNYLKGLIKSLVVVLMFTTCASVSQAQSGYQQNAVFYKVTGNDLEKPSYIFAILKFIPAEDYYFPAFIEDKFKECKILATETTLDHHTKHEMNKAAHLEHDKSLEDYLGEEYFKRLEDIFINQFGISKLKFDLVYKKFKPVMLSTTMTRLAMKTPLRYYEPDLVSKADANGMLTLGLETVEREVDALESFKIEDQVIALKHTISNLNKQVKEYEEVVKAYKAGDLHKTLEYTLHPVENNEDFRLNFIVKRNKEWVPKMIEIMHKESTFFAIGASHISEEDGVLHILEEQGYKVEPILK
jgi:hypothetical protein